MLMHHSRKRKWIPTRTQPRNLQQLGPWCFSHPRTNRPDHPLSCLNRDRPCCRLRMQLRGSSICRFRYYRQTLLGRWSNRSIRIRRIQRSRIICRTRQWSKPQASCLRRQQRKRNIRRCPQPMRQRLPYSLHLRSIWSRLHSLSLHCIIYVNAEK
jgi:hypothetical protein